MGQGARLSLRLNREAQKEAFKYNVLADCDRVSLNASNSLHAAELSLDAVNRTIVETNRLGLEYKEHLSKFNQMCEMRYNEALEALKQKSVSPQKKR